MEEVSGQEWNELEASCRRYGGREGENVFVQVKVVRVDA